MVVKQRYSLWCRKYSFMNHVNREPLQTRLENWELHFTLLDHLTDRLLSFLENHHHQIELLVANHCFQCFLGKFELAKSDKSMQDEFCSLLEKNHLQICEKLVSSVKVESYLQTIVFCSPLDQMIRTLRSSPVSLSWIDWNILSAFNRTGWRCIAADFWGQPRSSSSWLTSMMMMMIRWLLVTTWMPGRVAGAREEGEATRKEDIQTEGRSLSLFFHSFYFHFYFHI